MTDHDYVAGDVVFEEGAMPERVYFVVEGTVDLVSDEIDPDDHESWSFGESSIIGILDAVLERPRARRAVARTDSHVLSLRYDEYLDLLEDNFDFARAALEAACRTIHESASSLPADEVFKPPETSAVVSAEAIAQRALTLIERLLVLYNAPFFRGAPVQPLVTLAIQAEEVRYSAGQVLHEANEPTTTIWFVALGQVRADRDEPPTAGRFGPGDLLSAHAAIAYDSTLFRATAETDVVVLRIQKEDLFDLMEDHSRLTQKGFAFVANENERVRSIKAERLRRQAAAVNG